MRQSPIMGTRPRSTAPCWRRLRLLPGRARRERLPVAVGYFSGVKIKTGVPGTFKGAINEAGWLDDPVIAAGHLRQGKANFLGGFRWLLPAPSKKLPRHFMLALTADEVVVFGVTEVGESGGSAYTRLKIREGVRFRYPRESVSLTDLPEGAASQGGTITIEGESIPVMRPNRYGDPNTDELLSEMAGVPAVTWPR